MREAVIVSTARTPIGRAYKGSLIGERPDDLARVRHPKSDERTSRSRPRRHRGRDGRNVASPTPRRASTLPVRRACWPDCPIPFLETTVNRYCASSLQTIRMAYHGIAVGEGDAYVAAGVESTTRTQGVGFDGAHLNPRFTDPSRDDFINNVYIPMGMTAENVAEQFNVSRQRMDEFATLSQQRAVAAPRFRILGSRNNPLHQRRRRHDHSR